MWPAVGDFFPLEKRNGIATIGCDQWQFKPEAGGGIYLPEPIAAQGQLNKIHIQDELGYAMVA